MSLLDYARSANYGRFYKDLKEISRTNGKPAWLMFADAGICFLRYRSGLQDYLNFKFYEKDSRERSTYVTTGDEYHAYQVLASIDYADFFSNKVNFHKNFAKYARRDYCDPREGVDGLVEFMNKHEKFVRKPLFGIGGGGVRVVAAKDVDDVDAFCKELVDEGEFVEALVVQDPRWSALSPSINTLRMMTFVADGRARLVFTVARVGSGDSIMDNFHAGGVGVLVNMDRGVLMGNGFDKKCVEHETSVTGVRFDGYQIPFWEEAKAMVLEGAHVNEGVHLVGWDVAIAPDGPLVIEANRGAGWDVVQVPAKRGMKSLLNEMLEDVEAAQS